MLFHVAGRFSTGHFLSFAPPLYFAKFIFSEIVCFAKTPPPGPNVFRRAAVSVSAVIIRYSTGLFCCSSMDYLQTCVHAAFVCHPYSRAVSACAAAAFALLGLVNLLQISSVDHLSSKFVVANT